MDSEILVHFFYEVLAHSEVKGRAEQSSQLVYINTPLIFIPQMVHYKS